MYLSGAILASNVARVGFFRTHRRLIHFDMLINTTELLYRKCPMCNEPIGDTYMLQHLVINCNHYEEKRISVGIRSLIVRLTEQVVAVIVDDNDGQDWHNADELQFSPAKKIAVFLNWIRIEYYERIFSDVKGRAAGV